MRRNVDLNFERQDHMRVSATASSEPIHDRQLSEHAGTKIRPVVVQKYGGSSLVNFDAVRAVARRVVEDRREHGPLVVVVSAMGDETDRLLERARSLCETPSRRELAVLLSSGEQASTALLALAIQDLGEDAIALNGAQCGIVTDDSPLDASILEIRPQRVHEELARGRIVVAAGFQGVDPRGRTTTLGRGGSDTTAAALAAALDAERCEIYTDVEGVFSADPRIVPTARRLSSIDHEGMEELARQGSHVLKSEAVELARRNGVDIRVASASSGDGATTVQTAEESVPDLVFRPHRPCPVGISARADLLRLRLDRRQLGPAEHGKLQDLLSSREIVFFNENTAETGSRAYVSTAEIPGVEAFRRELKSCFGDAVEASDSLGAVTLVNFENETRKGALARVLQVMVDNDLEVVELYTSARSITLVVPEPELDCAVTVLHEAFVETHPVETAEDPAGRAPQPEREESLPPPRRATVQPIRPDAVPRRPGIELLLLGWGNIGRRLGGLVAERCEALERQLGFRVRIAAICDRSGFLIRSENREDHDLVDLIERKEAGHPVASLSGAVSGGTIVEMVRAASSEPSESRRILVDVSDADGADQIFTEALDLGCHVVTANKKPLAGHAEGYRRLHATARSTERALRGEATVGAGLPVLHTLEMLLLAGDSIRRIEGCLSGTLSCLMSWLEEGQTFSEAVARAVELGYTEPDPAADLTGADVSRKAMILGRLSGLATEETPVDLTGLVDSSYGGLELSELYERLRREVDGPMARRVEACRQNGEVLRYVARVTPGRIEVGPVAVSGNASLGMVQGPDNAIVFHSERYGDRPLAVTGPGAGVDVTAMGVLSDILRIGLGE